MITLIKDNYSVLQALSSFHSCAELAKDLTGREFQYVKDIEMCKDCDYGIALWDSKSTGTGENIKRLHALGKEMKVRLLKRLSH